jgi:hypothetical protein
MRLLKVDSPELELVEFFGNKIPEYAILSHTWGDDEVLYGDLKPATTDIRKDIKR